MSEINVKVNRVNSTNRDVKWASNRVSDSRSGISSLKSSVDSQILYRRNISSRFNHAISSLNKLESQLELMYHFINNSMDWYVEADKKASDDGDLDKPDEKSFWEKVGDGLGAIGNAVKGFALGIGDAIVSTAEGIWHAVTNPIDTVKGIVHVITHPIETASAIWDSIKNSWNNDVVNGDAEDRGRWFGRAFGEIALAVVGTKGVDKAVKLAKGAKVVDEPGGVKISNGDGKSGSNGVDIPNKIDGFDVTDGKVGGKIPVKDFEAIRLESIKNPNSDSLTLGKYTPTMEDGVPNWGKAGPDSYISVAKDSNSAYFDLGADFSKIQEKFDLSGDEMFEYFNAPALEDAIKTGKQIQFSHDPRLYPDSFLEQEWIYLKENHGFKQLIKEGDVWIAK